MWATTPGPSTTIGNDDLPLLFRANDQWALNRQSESFRATRTQLTLLLLATVFATLAGHFSTHFPEAMAAVLYGLTVAMTARTSRRRARAHWQAHRDAAETVKSLAWQYMVHGGPFHSRLADPDAMFAERLDERLRELRRVGWQSPESDAPAMMAGHITSVMRAVRAKPFEARRDIYLRDRMLEQLVWYRNRSGQAHRSAIGWSAVTTVLTLLALVAAGLRVLDIAADWDLTGLLAAAAATGVAWLEMRRHRPLSYAHALVEQDLETLRIAMGKTVSEQQWSEAVTDAERLMSPQYTDWLARFGS